MNVGVSVFYLLLHWSELPYYLPLKKRVSLLPAIGQSVCLLTCYWTEGSPYNLLFYRVVSLVPAIGVMEFIVVYYLRVWSS